MLIFMLIDGYIDGYIDAYIDGYIDDYWLIDDDFLVIHGYIDWIWRLTVFTVILMMIDGYWFSIGMVQVERTQATQASSKEPHCRNRDLSTFEVQAAWGGGGGLFNTWKNMRCFSLYIYIYCIYIYIININVTYIYIYCKSKWNTHTHIYIYTYTYYVIKPTGNGQYIM